MDLLVGCDADNGDQLDQYQADGGLAVVYKQAQWNGLRGRAAFASLLCSDVPTLQMKLLIFVPDMAVVGRDACAALTVLTRNPPVEQQLPGPLLLYLELPRGLEAPAIVVQLADFVSVQ